MAEYIDREKVLHAMKMDIRPPFAVVRDFPAADVAPVVRGKWISRMFGTHECSNCHNDPSHYDGATGYVEILSDHCPSCGAKMEREDEEDGAAI